MKEVRNTCVRAGIKKVAVAKLCQGMQDAWSLLQRLDAAPLKEGLRQSLCWETCTGIASDPSKLHVSIRGRFQLRVCFFFFLKRGGFSPLHLRGRQALPRCTLDDDSWSGNFHDLLTRPLMNLLLWCTVEHLDDFLHNLWSKAHPLCQSVVARVPVGTTWPPSPISSESEELAPPPHVRRFVVALVRLVRAHVVSSAQLSKFPP